MSGQGWFLKGKCPEGEGINTKRLITLAAGLDPYSLLVLMLVT